jgi:hypothetical protein
LVVGYLASILARAARAKDEIMMKGTEDGPREKGRVEEGSSGVDFSSSNIAIEASMKIICSSLFQHHACRYLTTCSPDVNLRAKGFLCIQQAKPTVASSLETLALLNTTPVTAMCIRLPFSPFHGMQNQ